ncbi:MAG: bifunctional 2-polyprenyl-6-hydroxyphenol methylase/3-demethylubiquinol 3-O-methyltransferase UbiG [Gammaproteobacteria bacterium]|nr:bifunctional 2-polyprenyl-6-hydroxyphenol methylase/3-demethylubiquinol 3-O-methyltransferase UbiG [Gammaproteobacteria bacterium]
MSNAPNVDAAELEKFSALAADWWKPDGPFRTLHEINPLRLDYIRRRAPLHEANVLDVGCGGGLLAEAMAGEGAHVTGIDMAPANVDIARSHAAAAGLAIDYQCMGVADIAATRPGAFDVVTCLELLEHVPRPDEVVAACAAAVRPGGTVFFSTINRNVKSFLFAIVGAEHVLRLVPRGTHEYLKLIQPSELAQWCRRAGLDVRELTGLHYNPLLRQYTLGGNVDVNYFLHTTRSQTAE